VKNGLVHLGSAALRDDRCQRLRDAVPDRRFKFQKSSQLFIGTHNNTLTVVAMRVSNPKRFRFLNAE